MKLENLFGKCSIYEKLSVVKRLRKTFHQLLCRIKCRFLTVFKKY